MLLSNCENLDKLMLCLTHFQHMPLWSTTLPSTYGRALLINHFHPRYVSHSAYCMHIIRLDCLANDRGEAGIPVVLKSSDSLVQQDQGAKFYLMHPFRTWSLQCALLTNCTVFVWYYVRSLHTKWQYISSSVMRTRSDQRQSQHVWTKR